MKQTTKPIDPRADDLFLEIFFASKANSQDVVSDILLRHYDSIERGSQYCYAAGTIPVLLVAHTDTVHAVPPKKVYYDPSQHTAWSPQGIGADDRAGVYAIASLLREGFRPHVLYTDEEEIGGWGAREAASCLTPDVRCMIQIDRAGSNDACTYQCASRPWRKWLRRKGWSVQTGTYTDIVDLMPAYGICGANLSTGYYNQHTTGEYLRTDQLARTISRVAAILKNPPQRAFAYAEARHKPLKAGHLERGWFGAAKENYGRCRTCRWEEDLDETGQCRFCAACEEDGKCERCEWPTHEDELAIYSGVCQACAEETARGD